MEGRKVQWKAVEGSTPLRVLAEGQRLPAARALPLLERTHRLLAEVREARQEQPGVWRQPTERRREARAVRRRCHGGSGRHSHAVRA